MRDKAVVPLSVRAAAGFTMLQGGWWSAGKSASRSSAWPRGATRARDAYLGNWSSAG